MKLLAIVLVAAGTYLTRFLPMKFGKIRSERFEEFLAYSSTALISALFVTSFISFPIVFRDLGVGLVAILFVFVTYRRWENLGISVLAGVLTHLLLSLSVQAIQGF
ncbi:hypothetical protein Asulf_02122 [Archaeoglobus sulfaticallidus PM70-1]|uniref:Branched-chain amino acid transport protein (AzlD) n=1 Tax=Archaeoglobus sulfaticallidus PM70-1 TaxID=387631 RepID=N0BGF8_9EURY|nr:AzlD domain-containing protein [Archaeoglobus sulfaticallidus]AGK62078.1 hypothetical protein Asulf_02122 [Archaeoglobus sulfaticallidus PM70-1]